MGYPKVYGFCDAGCRRQVPTYEEFEKSATYIEIPIDEDGSVQIEFGKTYKIFPRTNDQYEYEAVFSLHVKNFNTDGSSGETDYDFENFFSIKIDEEIYGYREYYSDNHIVVVAGAPFYVPFEGNSQGNIHIPFKSHTMLTTDAGFDASIETDFHASIAKYTLFVKNVEKVYAYNEEAEIVAYGKSAYEVALDNGFEGTEAEWLASLKGEPGEKGDGLDDVLLKVEAGEVHTANYMPPVDEFTNELMVYNADGSNTVMVQDSTSNRLSPYFEVPSGKKFTIQVVTHPTYNIGQCRTFVAFDENKNVIAGSALENAINGTIYDIPEGTKYLRICIGKSYIENAETWGAMFIVNDDGSFVGAYVENKTETIEGYKKLQPDVEVSYENLTDDAKSKIRDELGAVTDSSMENVSAKHIKSLRVSALSQTFTSAEYADAEYIPITAYTGVVDKCDWLYGLYDALVTRFPEYVTRTKIAETAEDLAPCYDSDGTERTNLKTKIPMYRYDFKPPIASRTLSSTDMYDQKVSLPKIFYVSGIHGGEQGPVFSGYRFFKMLCEKWRDHELLADLRWNVHFVVVPLANPFAFEYGSRRYDAAGNMVAKRNEHNIDISGNFPSENYVENEGSEYKYGTQPLTEPESIALYDIIQNEDFILSVDNHSFNWIGGEANTDKMAGYFIANHARPNSVNFWFKISRWLNQHVRKMSPAIDASYDQYDMAQVWTDGRQQMLNNTFRSVGANCEMTSGIHPTDKDVMGAETQAFRVDELTVIFYEALQDFYTY